MPKVWTLEEA